MKLNKKWLSKEKVFLGEILGGGGLPFKRRRLACKQKVLFQKGEK